MTDLETKPSYMDSELDLVNSRLEGIHDDVETSHGNVEETTNSSVASTVCATPADLSNIATHVENTTSSSTGHITSSADSVAEERRDSFNEAGGGRRFGLIQIKTVTRKKWSTNPKKGIKTTTKFFYQEVDSSWTVVLVVVCFFTAGMVDAVSYSCWGTFVSMQTGK
jgi:hypothetical protein